MTTTASQTPIAKEVEPLRADAIKRANEYANQIVCNLEKELADVDYDAEVIAKYPSGCYAVDFEAKKAKYQLVHSLFSGDKSRGCAGGHIPNTPWYVVKNDELVARFVRLAEENASAQYDAYISKLNSKIGPVDSATLTGNHVWDISFLEVQKADGTVETWKTQTIVNTSKLGKVFNQFPTRKVKNRN